MNTSSQSFDRRLALKTLCALPVAGMAPVAWAQDAKRSAAPSGDEKDQAAEQPAEAEPQTFLGKLNGAPDSARIGVVVQGQKFMAYCCSRDGDFNARCSRWIKGRIGAKGGIEAKSDDGVKLQAVVEEAAIQGALTDADGTAMKFKASPARTACSNAGLYRAEKPEDGDTLVSGWIVDDDDLSAGAARRIKARRATKAANDPTEDAARVDSADGATRGRRKFDLLARSEVLKEFRARFKGLGGNPALAVLMKSVKRFVGGQKGANPLETAVFAALSKAGKGLLGKLAKDFDGLGAAALKDIVGKFQKEADPKLPVTPELATVIGNRLNAPKIAATGKGAGTITSVRAATLTCVDETDPEILGNDEVVVVYTVVSGATTFTKTTQIYQNMKDGTKAQFEDGDDAVWPPPGQDALTTNEDVVISAVAFEVDTEDVKNVVAGIDGLLKAAGSIAGQAAGAAAGAVAGGPAGGAVGKAAGKVIGKIAGKLSAEKITKFVTFAAEGISNSGLAVQYLGGDVIIARGDGTFTAENGSAKNNLVLERKNAQGVLRSQYEISGFAVNK